MKPIRNRYGLPFRRFTPLMLAVVLPLLASWLTVWSGVSEKTPYALGLLSVALVASIGGTLSSATAVATTVAGRFAFLAMAGQPLPFTRLELARIVIIFAAAMIISVMTGSRRKAQAALEVAHAELQNRTDALVESLQSSK